MVWASSRPLPGAPVIPAWRGLDRSGWLRGGWLHLGNGLHCSCSCGGCCCGDGSRSLSWLWVGSPSASIISTASFSDGAARGSLFTTGWWGESGGSSCGGAYSYTIASANTVVKVWGPVVSIRTAIGWVVYWRPRSSSWHWGSTICSEQRGSWYHCSSRGNWSRGGGGNVGPLGHGTGFGEKYRVLSNATFRIHQISWDIVLDRSYHNPFQQHKTESQSHKAHYQGHGTQPRLLPRPHSTGATAKRARCSGRCLLSPWLFKRHGR